MYGYLHTQFPRKKKSKKNQTCTNMPRRCKEAHSMYKVKNPANYEIVSFVPMEKCRIQNVKSNQQKPLSTNSFLLAPIHHHI